jgi:NAD(P)-dependent dehydrogenase (short-subunit alcohol dehydrogenase family)
MAARLGPVIVTGANSGIGLASVLRFAARGFETWGTVRSEDKADELREAAAEAGCAERVRPLVLDVSDHERVVEAWKELPDFYAVVNNAGFSQTGAVEEVSAALARAQLDVNLISPAVVAGCALPGMRRLGAGRIVMVSSVAGRAAVMPLNGWYHASKFGLEALSDVLRVEVASFGVAVSIVEPGFFKTGITTRARDIAAQRAAHADSPYASAYERMDTLVELVERFAPPASWVARAIVSAVESRSPLRRYVVGLDALATIAAETLAPRALTDFAMRVAANLNAKS